MAAKPTNRRRTREDGFTLVEVLAATVITSILVLGLANLWTAVAGEVDGLTMRQKAIFVLNGQMERLTALY
ncbi:MAG: prepilin-type N-terminal cleavage/methylation domain-containing protein, partial [Rhodospirillaceae bacterium]|nr:prepilin-type N-terminal cleavage/methylation domain-containing protein [Rhodospirillaceae bacterium]